MRFGPTTFALVLCTAACSEPLDTTRNVSERGTLGEEIHRVIHRDLVREDPARADGFLLSRDRFVGAVDHMFREDELSDLQDLLVGLLPLYDDGTIPQQTRRLGAVAGRLSEDQAALGALAAIGNRIGYVDLTREEALFRRIASFPQYRTLMHKTIDFALAHDGLDAQGNPDPNEDDTVARLIELTAEQLRDIELSDDAQRNIVLAADLMLTEDTRLATMAPSSDAPVIVARDVRGMAAVAQVAGQMPEPFVDSAPQDGLPDIDTSGRFVDLALAPIDIAPFDVNGARDDRARAVDDNGALTYQYVELDQTLLAGGLRDGRTLIEREIPSKMRTVADAVLGDRGPEGRFIAQGSPLVGLTHALTRTIEPDQAVALLDVARILLEEHEGTMTYALRELQAQLDVADRYPVSLRPGSTMFDDMMSVLRRVLDQPGMLEEVIDALENNPDFLTFPSASATLMEHKKTPITEADFMGGRVFDEPVDRSRPDTRDNQSLHQRVLHLIYDTRGVRYRPELLGVPLGFIFEIEDLGEFYMLSVIGEAEIPSLVSTLTGLAERPTPAELAAFINEDQLFGNAIGNEGLEVRQNDGDTLFAVSASGMDRALAPLVRIFYDRGQLDLLFDIFEVLHLHYATAAGADYQDQSRNQPRYSQLSGVRDFEPMLIEIYRDVHIMEAAKDLMLEMENIRTPGGQGAKNVLLRTVRKAMKKDTALATADGRFEVTIDGKRISPLSPFDLIRSALDQLDRKVGSSVSSDQAWSEIVDTLDDLYMQTESTGPKSARFTNERMIPTASILLHFLRDRADHRSRDGTLAAWLQQDVVQEVSDAIGSETLPVLLDLVDLIEQDPELDGLITELRDEMLAEDDGFPDVLALVGDALGAAKDASVAAPFLRFMGREMHPDDKLVFEMLSFAQRARDYDPGERLLEIVRRGLEPTRPDGIYLYGLSKTIQQTNRADPRSQDSLDATDVGSITSRVASYLLDDQHGMEKFYELVAHRNGAPTTTREGAEQ